MRIGQCVPECVQVSSGAVRIWGTGHGMVMCWGCRGHAGDMEVRAHILLAVLDSQAEQRCTQLQCIGQKRVRTDRRVSRRKKSMAEEGSSSTEISQQCSDQPTGVCG